MIVTADRIEASTERARKYGIVAVASRTRDVRPPAKLTAEQKERRYRSLLQETRSADQASRLLERVIGGNDLVGINYLSRGLVAARAVGRIHLRDAQGDDIGYGTGFLVAPGLALTNNHVFGSDADAATGILEFDYEKDVSGRDRPTHRFTFEPDRFFATSKELDFTLVAVAARSDTQRALSEFGWLPLRIEPGKAIVGEYLTIIQHPGGEQKQICVRENKLLKYLPDTIWYQTDTVAGSSGSPVFNNAWEVVALHHSGVPDTDKEGHWLTVDGKIWDSSMSEDKVRWLANEGIRISRIVEHLKANFPGEPLLAPIFRGQRPEAALLLLGGMSSTDPRPNGNGAGISITPGPNGTITLTLPQSMNVQLATGRPDLGAPAPNPPVVTDAARPSITVTGDDSALVEKVDVDQSNYARRPGYKAGFIGTDVPLPTLSPKLKKLAAKLKDGSGEVIKYWNYSVVMNTERRLAFFSAVNVDGKLRRSSGAREGDRWYLDPRVDESIQITDDFYKGRTLDEARKTPFDRGHLVRRLDATWGTTTAEAKRNGDDTFHFTNCSPQHYLFNQGKQLWAGIEDYVLQHVENAKQKACIINGPVFRPDDGKYGGVLVPRQFWKILAFQRGNRLSASGYLLSQETLIKGVVATELSDEQARVFQRPIREIEKLTGLNFGPLPAADAYARAGSNEAAVLARPLATVDAIVV